MYFIKPSGSSGDYYRVIHSQVCKMVFIVDNLFKECKSEEEQNKRIFLKCERLIAEDCGMNTVSVFRTYRNTKLLKDQGPTVFMSPTKAYHSEESYKPRRKMYAETCLNTMTEVNFQR